jgi:Tol biopolymer transport system component
MALSPEAHTVPTETTPLAPYVPTVSPIRVSFVNSARNLFVWSDGTGSPVQLTSSGDAIQSYVSPDGSLIVFTRSSDYISYQVDIINYDGTNQRTLLTNAQINALPRPSGAVGILPNKIAWIPGSRSVAMKFQVQFEGPGLQYLDQLYVLDTDTAALTSLITVGSSWNFVYSPDGSKILITRPEGIDLYNANGSLAVANVITHAFVNTASEYAWVAEPTWSPDGSAFAAGIPPADPWADSPAPTMIYKMSNTGVSLSTFSTTTGFFPTSSTFSPDLTKMSFTTRVGAPADNNWALHTANIDGSSDSIITTGYFKQLPVWAPDGNHYIYAVGLGASPQTYLGTVGSSPTLLGEISSIIDVRWVDSSRYVISNQTGSGASLLLGTVGSGFGVIYNDPGPFSGYPFGFDINR